MRAEDYTIGWLCALPFEFIAAKHMLDEEHASSKDTSTYALGQIGQYNVVIACLSVGRTKQKSVATVTNQLLSEYPSVQVCLVVGIGSGVPSTKSDIRLGDVVVALRHEGHGGLIWYEDKRSNSGQPCLPIGTLNRAQASQSAPRTNQPVQSISQIKGVPIDYTGVWSLETLEAPPAKKFRLLSEERKQAYQRARQGGACQNCKRTKARVSLLPS